MTPQDASSALTSQGWSANAEQSGRVIAVRIRTAKGWVWGKFRADSDAADVLAWASGHEKG